MADIQNSCNTSLLVCPETNIPLRVSPYNEAKLAVAGKRFLVSQDTSSEINIDQTGDLFVRHDNKCAYKIINGIPILMAPERLSSENNVINFDLSDAKYAEAYEEMAHYNEYASKESENIEQSEAYEIIKPILRANLQDRMDFPYPKEIWIDAVYDCASQWDAYHHLRPIKGKRLLQLGGKGIHAVKWLLAGAKEAWVGTPMLGEAIFAMALAKAAGVSDRLFTAVLVAEELPFVDNTFDGIYIGGCLHHMVTPLALVQCKRILMPGGKFSAAEPWKAPLHSIGTRIFGKREPNVHCKPLTNKRMESLCSTFEQSSINHHGSLLRYPLLALSKIGIKTSLQTSWFLNKFDDRFCSLIPGLKNLGSSVAILATK